MGFLLEVNAVVICFLISLSDFSFSNRGCVHTRPIEHKRDNAHNDDRV
jgi:hypothetical protein